MMKACQLSENPYIKDKASDIQTCLILHTCHQMYYENGK